MFSSCLGKSSLHCSKNNRSKSPYFILAARKLEREENNRGEANCGTTPLRGFFRSRSNLQAANLVFRDN